MGVVTRTYVACCKCGRRSREIPGGPHALPAGLDDLFRELETIGWKGNRSDMLCPSCRDTRDQLGERRTVKARLSFTEVIKYRLDVYVRLDRHHDTDVEAILQEDGWWFEVMERQYPDFMTGGSVDSRELEVVEILDDDVAGERACQVCGGIDEGNTCCPPEDDE